MKNILISRTDNIGDVILTLPAASLLKQKFPEANLFFLARDYVKAIIDSCPDINHFVSWDALSSLSTIKAENYLKSLNLDAVLHVFPSHQIARLCKKADIPHRIGTSRRWFHYLTCNQRVSLSRSKSALHEAQLNLKLLAPFNISTSLTLPEITALIHLTPKPPKEKYRHFFDAQKFNLIIHPFSNGNGREWPLAYFQQLINELPHDVFNILVTGSKGETNKVKRLLEKCPHAKDLSGLLNLEEFLQLIAQCDGLIASGTGPLHMAAAVGIKTLGLYPPIPSAGPKRWAPLGKEAKYLVAEQTCNTRKCSNCDCRCMQAIQVSQVKKIVFSWKE